MVIVSVLPTLLLWEQHVKVPWKVYIAAEQKSIVNIIKVIFLILQEVKYLIYTN